MMIFIIITLGWLLDHPEALENTQPLTEEGESSDSGDSESGLAQEYHGFC